MLTSNGIQLRKILLGIALVAWVLGSAGLAAAAPLNVIVMIADGMGAEQVKAGAYYAGAPLSFEGAPHQAQMITDSESTVTLGGFPTDSAAAATAMSTGQKVSNFVVSVATPGDQSNLETMVETFSARGKSTGLVSNSYITDGTPAGFGSHAIARTLTSTIASGYLNDTRPDVLLGGGGNGMDPVATAAAGYTVVTDRTGLQAINPQTVGPLAGLFGTSAEGMPYEWDYDQGFDLGYDTLPFLTEMTSSALSVLENDPNGFFLMVEQENTDKAGHEDASDPHRLARAVFAAIEFSNAVQIVLDWAAGRTDTLIIVTADHETGGLEVLADNGAGVLPTVAWNGSGFPGWDHSGVNVPVYAWGPNADLVTGIIDNTEIHTIATIPEPSSLVLMGLVGLTLVVVRRNNA
ncbi:MAG: PEP-CTERM sorting domain-containing protein [bacterium]|nr:PEP-CTERM sorting domain-containing protein [bacterium]